MKIYQEDDKGKAFCADCSALVGTTFLRRDVPFSDGQGLAKHILVAACDACGQTVAVPAQSTPAISKARKEAAVSIEVSLPAIYLDVLDCAAFTIDHQASTDFRKTLLSFFVHKAAHDARAAKRLRALCLEADERFPSPRGAARRRLSMKVAPPMMAAIQALALKTELNTTELVKSMVCLVQDEVLTKPQPGLIQELRTLAAVSS